jgi:hypothetical protein
MTKGERNKDKVKKGERNKDRERKEREKFLNLSTQIGGASS